MPTRLEQWLPSDKFTAQHGNVYLVAIDPLDDLVALVEHSLTIVITYLVLQLFILDRLLQVERVALQSVLRLKTITLLIVLLFVCFSITNHLLNLLLAQTTCALQTVTID